MREEAFRIEYGAWAGTPRIPVPRWVPAGLLVLTVVLGGCARDGSAKTKAEAPVAAPVSSEPEVLATIGDEQVTLADVRTKIGDQLDQLEMRYLRQRHKAIETTLETVLRDRLIAAEAKTQNKSPDELLAAEAGGTFEPTPIEVQAWYNENLSRVRGRPLEQVESQIVELLRNQRRNEAAKKLEERLNRDHKVVVNLEPFRVALQNDGAPSLGPADAPITLVEFSDFQCPYCKGMVPTLRRLEESHGKQVRIVYRQYPIPSLHANAIKAAEASLCAHEQGKFWEMHDLMFEEQGKLTVAELKEKAARLKLNRSKFDGCMDTGRFTEQVQEDMKAGVRIGVTGTPALFVNGVPIDGGAVPYETLVKAIDKELARLKR